MFKKVFSLIMVLGMLCSGPVFAADTQVDALLKKLVEKGLLTEEEGTQMQGEIISDEKNIRETNMKKDLPDWVQNLKLGGDMRVRMQTERRSDDSANAAQRDRVRGRIRARLNLEAKVNDKAKVVVGISTDGGNARSTNATFGGNTANSSTPFSKTNIVLNKAYGQYTFNDRFSVTAGKMDNPIWEPMEFLWDADITPEGASARYDYKVSDSINVFALGNFFALNEYNPSTSDTYMVVGQVGGTVKPTEKMDVKVTGSYYNFSNLKSGFANGRSTTGSATAFTNTPGLSANGTNSLLYKFNMPVAAAEIGFNDLLGEDFPIYIPRIAAFGEYAYNPSPDTENTAWMLGGYLGNSKVNGWKTWKLTGAYKVIGKDSWLDIFPDSDFYAGGTDVRGYEGIIELGLAKNLSFVLDYYSARRYSQSIAKAPEHVLQADINWKF